MRPAVSAETTRRSSGTSVPLPRTWRSISPFFTVSIHSVPRSTVGAAGRSCDRPTVVTTTTTAAMMIMGLVRLGGLTRGMSIVGL
jgi:hypothetical protein